MWLHLVFPTNPHWIKAKTQPQKCQVTSARHTQEGRGEYKLLWQAPKVVSLTPIHILQCSPFPGLAGVLTPASQSSGTWALLSFWGDWSSTLNLYLVPTSPSLLLLICSSFWRNSVDIAWMLQNPVTRSVSPLGANPSSHWPSTLRGQGGSLYSFPSSPNHALPTQSILFSQILPIVSPGLLPVVCMLCGKA